MENNYTLLTIQVETDEQGTWLNCIYNEHSVHHSNRIAIPYFLKEEDICTVLNNEMKKQIHLWFTEFRNQSTGQE